jgi:hypothetical protein
MRSVGPWRENVHALEPCLRIIITVELDMCHLLRERFTCVDLIVYCRLLKMD